MRLPAKSRGFTLVELLVVIGIIALLISILLPALNSARRSANAVKCAAGLRDLGNAYKFYAADHQNYYPPGILFSTATTYNVDGIDYPYTIPTTSTKIGAYWYTFLAKYITKTKVGAAGAGDALNNASVRTTLFWGCPSFDGYPPSSATSGMFDTNPIHTGYGMNGYPTFNQGNPANPASGAAAFPPAKEAGFDAVYKQPLTDASVENGPTTGGFVKANIWGKRGAERLLLADARIWRARAGFPTVSRSNKQVPTQLYGDSNVDVAITNNETTVSLWRHSRLPNKTGGYFDPNKSKVAFNVLYCDGHVETHNDPIAAYKALRMRFPG